MLVELLSMLWKRPKSIEAIVSNVVQLNPLAGLPLDYLIGAGNQKSRAGRIVEVGYDADIKPNGLAIAYCNLFDEKNTGELGPYLHNSDTAEQYNEGQIDPFFLQKAQSFLAVFSLPDITQWQVGQLEGFYDDRSHD